MTNPTRSDHDHPAGEPPGGGRQDHDAMRAAALRPVSGPASTDSLAAGGGLEVPGGDPAAVAHAHVLEHVETTAPVPEPIPGERDPSTLTSREPGAIGGRFTGADTPPPDPRWVDERTAADRALEGGGEQAERRRS